MDYPINIGVFLSFILWKSSIGNLSHCEFLSETPLLCLENIFSGFPQPLTLKFFLPTLHDDSKALRKDNDIEVPFSVKQLLIILRIKEHVH